MAAVHGIVLWHGEVMEARHEFGRVDAQGVIACRAAAVIVQHPETSNLRGTPPNKIHASDRARFMKRASWHGISILQCHGDPSNRLVRRDCKALLSL